MINKDAIIVGGGPAGLAAAVRLKKNGVDSVLIIEREKHLGGILRQCIHDGFGLIRFSESLSGPEYAQRFIDEVNGLKIEAITDTSVINISPDKIVTTASRDGLVHYQAKAVILTMGCRERTRGAIGIPGFRPAGIYNAGVAQSYMNLHNTMVGKKIIILGSGDIGLIMARRFTLEGAQVKAVFEILPYPSGLPRNIEQCLNDYNIPLYLSHTVTKIHGERRIEGITVSEVDANLRIIDNTAQYFECDTLVLSVGLIPENELSQTAGVAINDRTRGAIVDDSFQTSIPGIFAAGNVLHVHDLVDYVSIEAEDMADAATLYIKKSQLPKPAVAVTAGENVGSVIPHKISSKKDFKLYFRVSRPMENCTIIVSQGDNLIKKIALRKAIPAEMLRIEMKSPQIISGKEMEVKVL